MITINRVGELSSTERSPTSEATPYRFLGQTWSFGRVVAVLFALCFVLRVVAFARLDVISLDGAYYISTAEHLEHGDLAKSFSYTGPNLYPPLLALLKRLTGDRELGGQWWSVIASTITILPFIGWLRRLFDDVTALVGGLMFAVHPCLIKWSPEPIRDPTFWLLFVVVLYSLRHALDGSPAKWLGTAIVVAVAAAFVRKEAVLLTLPIFGTSLLLANGGRGPLSKNVRLAALLICGVFLVGGASAYTALQSRLVAQRATAETNWLTDRPESPPRVYPFIVNAVPIIPAEVEPPKMGRVALRFVEQMFKAFTPIVGLLALGGMWRNRRLLATAEHGFIAAMNVALSAATAYYLYRNGDMNTRYLLPIVICAIPFAARQLRALPVDFARLRLSMPNNRRVVATVVMLMVLLGFLGAWQIPDAGRRDMAALGMMLRRNHGCDFTLGYFGNPFLICHYAGTKDAVALRYPPVQQTRAQLQMTKPEFVVVQGDAESIRVCQRLVQSVGYARVDLSGIVADQSNLALFELNERIITMADVQIRR